MPLLEPRVAFKPFEFPQFFDFYKKQQQMHWTPSEVPMEQDLADFRKLTDAERSLVVSVLRLFTQTDVDVSNNYNVSLIPAFPLPEVRMMLGAFAGMELVHAESYSFLSDTLGLDDAEYSAFLKDPAMVAKRDFMLTFPADDVRKLALNLAVFGGCVEGTMLYSSFACLMHFPRLGKMKGVGQIVTMSARDENLHSTGISELFRVLCAGHEGLHEAVEAEVGRAFDRAVALEDAFIDSCFSAGKVQGLDPTDLKAYVRHMADRRLVGLGYGARWKAKSPFPWVDLALYGKEHASFFEVRPTEYSRGSVVLDW